jgi:hypothetical protein
LDDPVGVNSPHVPILGITVIANDHSIPVGFFTLSTHRSTGYVFALHQALIGKYIEIFLPHAVPASV